MKKNLNRTVNLGLLFLGTLCQLYLLLDTVGCAVSAQYPLWVGLLCLLIWYGVHTRRGLLIALPIFTLLTAGMIRYLLPDLKLQLQDFFDRITGVFYETVLYRGRAYPFLNAVQDHTVLFLLFSVLIAGYIAVALSSRGARTSLVLIGALPLFAVCILINEKPPIPAVVGLALFLFLTAVGGNFYWEGSGSFSAVLGTALPLTALLCALLLFINPEEYAYEPPKLDLREEIREILKAADQWADDLMEKHEFKLPEFLTPTLPENGEGRLPQQGDAADANLSVSEGSIPAAEAEALIWQGIGGTLDLTQKAGSEELDKVFLRVKAGGSGRLYLRGSSFGDYTGTGWKPSADETEFCSLPYAANAIAAIGGEEQVLTVRDSSSAAYRFLPYFSRESGNDSYVPSDGASRYDAAFFTIPSMSDVSELPKPDENEVSYRSYAHSAYTRLPDSTRASLLPLLAQAGLVPGGENLVAGVAAFVQRAGTYDLNTPAYPSNDYAAYFLTTAHQGYCIHFATAAAAAYRSLGIPARVVAGFVTETSAGSYTDVKGSDAHAWVEVYQDGIGWLPVEVTGQRGIDGGIPGPDESEQNTEAENAGMDETGEEPVPAEGSMQETAALPQNPSEQSDLAEEEGGMPPSPTPAPTASLPIGPVTQPVPSPDPAAVQRRATERVLLLCFILFVLPPAAVLLRRMVILALRRHATEQPDTHKAVVAVYRTAEKIARFGADIPKEIVSCAEKAAFSAHTITPEEAAASRAHLHLLQHRVYERQSRWNRFRFKYLNVLI